MVDSVSVPPSQPDSNPTPSSDRVAADIEGAVQILAGKNKTITTVTGRTPPQQPAPTGERPAWLPEKFKSPEDMARAYGELEKRMGAGIPPDGQPSPQPVPSMGLPVPADPQQGQPQPNVTPAATDLVQKMSLEFAQQGNVSPETRRAFVERTGLPESYIDSHVQHMQRQGSEAFEMAVQRLGGQQAVAELQEWARARLPARDIEAFNTAVYSGNPNMVQLALDGLAAKYEAEVGRAPRVIAGRKPQGNYGGVTPFQSEAELSSAVRSKRYKEDPAFRAEVEDRLRVAQELGIL